MVGIISLGGGLGGNLGECHRQSIYHLYEIKIKNVAQKQAGLGLTVKAGPVGPS